jgi:triosephosphate isomerase
MREMSKRKKIVAGNWKMNTGFDEAVELVKGILKSGGAGNDIERIVFPPFPYLKTIREILIEESAFFVGAQNCSEHEKGAYTGEVSARMIREVGCRYVLVGHSERRTYFKEDAEQLKKKIAQALNNHLHVILCVGERLEERKASKHFDVVEAQLREALSDFPGTHLTNLVLAYEPVWAIGTGETASPAQAQEMHAKIRQVFSALFGKDAAQDLPILYGGSCTPKNAKELFSCPDVDGGLIGGASLNAADFDQIARSFE